MRVPDASPSPVPTGVFLQRHLALAGAGVVGLAGLSAISAAVTGFNALVAVRPAPQPPSAVGVAAEASPRRGFAMRLTLTGPGVDNPGWVGVIAPGGRLLAGPVDNRDAAGAVTRDCAPLPGFEAPLLEAGTTVSVTADPWSGCEDPLALGEDTHEVPTYLRGQPGVREGPRRAVGLGADPRGARDPLGAP